MILSALLAAAASRTDADRDTTLQPANAPSNHSTAALLTISPLAKHGKQKPSTKAARPKAADRRDPGSPAEELAKLAKQASKTKERSRGLAAGPDGSLQVQWCSAPSRCEVAAPPWNAKLPKRQSPLHFLQLPFWRSAAVAGGDFLGVSHFMAAAVFSSRFCVPRSS